MGTVGLISIRDQHVLRYPATGQIMLYMGIPIIALLCLVCARVASRKDHWSWSTYPVTTFLAGFAILPTLMVWGGGV
jgi:hypothetical protein